MPPRHARLRNQGSAFERSLLRLRVLCDKLQDDATFKPSQLDLAAAVEDLMCVKAMTKDPEGIDGVFSLMGPRHLAGLTSLYAVALRRSCAVLDPGASDGVREECASLRKMLAEAMVLYRNAEIEQRVSAGAAVVLARAILRTDAFRCYAVLLSSAASQLAQRRSSRNAEAVAKLLREVPQFLNSYNSSAVVEELGGEVYRELIVSGLLEHLARAVVLLSGFVSHGSDFGSSLFCIAQQLLLLQTSRQAKYFMATFQDSPCLSYLQAAHLTQLCAALDGGLVYGMPASAGAGEGAAASDTTLLFGPYGVRAGTTADTVLARWSLSDWAFTIRQARQELSAALPANPVLLSMPAARRLPGVPRPPQRIASSAPPAVAAPVGEAAAAETSPAAAASLPPGVERWLACAAVPPIHTRAAFDVSMRLASAAVEAMPVPRGQDASAVAGGGRDDVGGAAATAGAGAGGSGQAGSRGAAGNAGRWSITGGQQWGLAVRALQCAREACIDEAASAVAEAPAPAAAPQKRLQRFWSLVLLTVQRWLTTEESEEKHAYYPFLLSLLTGMAVPVGATDDELPPSAAPDVAAALASGYVPGVERMLRLSAQHSRWPRLMLSRPGRGEHVWCQLLAFGPLRETLSLLASAAKYMRLAAEGSRQPVLAYRYHVRAVELLVAPWPLVWLTRAAAQRAQETQTAPGLPGTKSPCSQRREQQRSAVPSGAGCGGGGGGGGGGSGEGSDGGRAAAFPAGLPRLRVATSYIVLHLLPLLFRTVPVLVANLVPVEPNWYGLDLLLPWVPLLAAAHSITPWGGSLLAGEEWNLGGVLGAALGLLLVGGVEGVQPALVKALRALLHLAPTPLAEALPGAASLATAIRVGDADTAAAAQAAVRGAPGGQGQGAAGANQASQACANAVLRLAFSHDGKSPEPELLAALESLLCASRRDDGGGATPAAAAPLAAMAAAVDAAAAEGAAAAGQQSSGGRLGLCTEVRDLVAAAALLVPPAEVASLLPACANPRCTNLSGPSELALERPVLRCCPRCGMSKSYCSAGCREQHEAVDQHLSECARVRG